MFPFHIKNFDFVKVHGLGNDFIIFDQRLYGIPEEVLPSMARTICRRSFYVGGDGMILVCEPTSSNYDIRFRSFNDDGSEAEMSGNGIRVFAKYVYEQSIVKKLKMNVETKRGLVIPELMKIVGGNISGVKVNMGAPILEPREVPVIADEPVLDAPITIEGRTFNYSAVSMGNPHCVIFTTDLTIETVQKYGAILEAKTDLFPNKTNVEFVRVLSVQEADFRSYERGVGVTNACGTGASAAGVAGVMLGKFKKNHPIIFHMMEGDLTITYTGETVFMEGPATEVYCGHIDDLIIE